MYIAVAGPVPDAFGALTQLTSLHLDHNNLTGERLLKRGAICESVALWQSVKVLPFLYLAGFDILAGQCRVAGYGLSWSLPVHYT